MKAEYPDGSFQAQKVQEGRKDIAESQPVFGQASLHRGSSDFASKLQRTMWPEEVVMASEQFAMIFQPLCSPSVA